MANGAELYTLTNGIATEPTFETAMRGYERKQVDRYVSQAEGEIVALAGERDEAFDQLRLLTEQVHQLQQELAVARSATAAPVPANVSFRHLGSRVEQILALAEDQAEAIKADAAQGIAAQRAEVEQLLEKTRAEASAATRDFEIALAARRAEEEAALAERRESVETELAAAEERARQ